MLVLVAACGRIGFDPSGATHDADPTRPDADPTRPDADPTAPDAAPAVCGDLVCTIASGETCQTCADCATADPVCGNGMCDTGVGEDTTSCFDDCGPVWSPAWLTFEQQIHSMIDGNRQMVFDCPGMQNLPAVQALTLDPGLTALARNMAWDLTHHDYPLPLPPDGARCNGQDMFTLMSDAGYTGARGYAYTHGFTSPTEVIDSMFTDDDVCPMLMNGVYTMIGVGHADDVGPPLTVVTVH